MDLISIVFNAGIQLVIVGLMIVAAIRSGGVARILILAGAIVWTIGAALGYFAGALIHSLGFQGFALINSATGLGSWALVLVGIILGRPGAPTPQAYPGQFNAPYGTSPQNPQHPGDGFPR